MSRKLRIGVITGSVRQGRMGEKVARWFIDLAAPREALEIVPIDLLNWPLPHYAHPKPPKVVEATLPTELEQSWLKLITSLDGVVVVTPEYNHGYPAALKNALDYVYTPWNAKPIAFVSYGGSSGGVRSVEKLRLVSVELQMVPIREEVNIPFIGRAFDDQGRIADTFHTTRANSVLDQLTWWAQILVEAREHHPYPGTAPKK